MGNSDTLYIDLSKKTISFSLWPEPPAPIGYAGRCKGPIKKAFIEIVNSAFALGKYRIGIDHAYSSEQRKGGEIWPNYADTMNGIKRLDNLRSR